ncbi:GNAT family N-acetyltransferase [Enterococcus sp. HY326]|uniref:GNAT family N-acetyltransferase n=1 Tax=Enterococcus sp. HY326 TaxID=2971265 RepID=UPI00223E908B|nr:GNAT family N-acetyltransferase [Enterococcus sp. HY326]
MILREYQQKDLPAVTAIWNEVVADGLYFPQESELSAAQAEIFFAEQTRTQVAELAGEVVGFYILHPNSIGRIGHVGNASYGVKRDVKGQKIGEQLVRDSLKVAKASGFQLMQFNAVVANNAGAIHLYEKIGFQKAGAVPQGFRLPSGEFEDYFIYYYVL